MKDDAIRISIACERGWKRLEPYSVGRHLVDWPVFEKDGKRSSIKTGTIPDYPNDLNAAISLVNILADEGWRCHCDNGLDKTWEVNFHREKPDAAIYAPADTLALAICQGFLKVRGKWKEEPVPV